MSAEKKVLLLLLALIVLIVVCVNMHLPNFMKNDDVLEITKVEKKEEIADVEKVINTSIEPKIEEQESKIDEEIEIEDNIENTQNLEDTENIENIEEENEAKIIENEVPKTPLITTDKRYNRTANEKNIEELSRQAQELQIKISEYVRENPVSFTRGSFELTKNSKKSIDMIVEALKEFDNIKIEVAGHTDAAGAASFNLSISQKRAQAVKEVLVALGIEESRIIARGYGEDIPLVKNSPNGYSKINRRVEFNIVEE